jgi:two-component sensor histidine kinase
VQPLALIFHELVTNAFKYGALASPAGRLGVRWRLQEAGDLRIEWTEQTAGPVAPPKRKGFGSQLITRAASFDLDGEAEMDFRADGLQCRLRIPLRADEAFLLREAVSSASV